MNPNGLEALETLLGERVLACEAVAANAVARIDRVRTEKGVYALKQSRQLQMLSAEAAMLRYLHREVPALAVPELVAEEAGMLVTEFIEHGGRCDETEVAQALAALHAHTAPSFGFEISTPIGLFMQSNDPTDSWVEFFTTRRLLPFAYRCYKAGGIGAPMLARLEALAGDLGQYLEEPPQPSLLHGDIWSGNVLCRNGRAVFIDPALYYGHCEAELAFIRMFHTYSDRFFDAYHTIRPIEPGFFELRSELYNLYPYLVHVLAFGDAYVSGVDSILKRAGY